MSHVRQQIRERVVADLTADVTAVAGRVYDTQFYALRDGNLPGIAVYSPNEVIVSLSMGPSHITRNLTIFVDIYVAANTLAPGTSDAICAEIETSLGTDFTANGLAKEMNLVATDSEYLDHSETKVVLTRMTFDVQYVTSRTDAETAR